VWATFVGAGERLESSSNRTGDPAKTEQEQEKAVLIRGRVLHWQMLISSGS
jgi:hypothetical protein